jgi:hypothetical protein
MPKLYLIFKSLLPFISKKHPLKIPTNLTEIIMQKYINQLIEDIQYTKANIQEP